MPAVLHELQRWYEVLVLPLLALVVGLALSPEMECAGLLRAMAGQLTDRAIRMPPFSGELRLHDAAAISDREWIAVTDSAVIRWSGGAEQTLLELAEPRFGWKRGDLRIAPDGSWSYAAASFDDPARVDVALLASTGAAVTRISVPVSGVPLVWSSLPTAEPSAILISADEGAGLRVERITRAGAQHIATVSAPTFYPPGASICQLPDGRVVLAALGDDPRVARTVALHVIGAAGVTQLLLRSPGSESLRELFTAVSPGGLLCVVARSEHGTLAAAIVDVDRPGDTEFRAVTSQGDRAAIASVAHIADRFVVAWLSAANTAVVVRELRDDRIPLPPITIATAAALDNPLLTLRSGRQDLALLARTRAGVMLWYVTPPIAGRAGALAYVRARCSRP